MTETPAPAIPDDNPAVRDLINLGAALNAKVSEWDADGFPDVITALVPDGFSLQHVSAPAAVVAARSMPRRVKAVATVTDTVSWLAYFRKYGGERHSEVFGDVRTSNVTAILNAPLDASMPGFGDHRVELQLTHSPAWQAWTRLNGQLVDQTAFAEHIEDRTPDMIEPTAADMLEVAQSIHATTEVHFQSGSRLVDGQQRFQYIEDVTGGAGQRGDMAIPTQLKLQLQVWRGVDIAVPVTARFRYRPAAKGLRVGIVLDRMDDVLDGAWSVLLSDIAGELPVPVLAGRPPTYAS